MEQFTKQEIVEILKQHELYSHGEGGRQADLSNANLSDADLSNADLSNADLWKANLWKANLSDVTMNWTSNVLIAERLRQATNDSNDDGILHAAALIKYGDDTGWCWEWYFTKGVEIVGKETFNRVMIIMRSWIKYDDVLPDEFEQWLGVRTPDMEK